MCVPEYLSSEYVEAVVVQAAGDVFVPPALHAWSNFIRGDERETAQSHTKPLISCATVLGVNIPCLHVNYRLFGEDEGGEAGAVVPHYCS